MRRSVIATLVLLLAAPALATDLSGFDRYFVDATLRIDYLHTGNATEEIATLDQVFRQGIWAGSRVHLVDGCPTGNYCARLFDAAGGALLFSRSFDSYFGEYTTTADAAAGVRRAYHESILAPYPKAKVRFVLERRQRDRTLKPFFSTEIDPDAFTVNRQPLSSGAVVVESLVSGDPHGKVDVVILGEGYTATEEGTFRKDLARFTEMLFTVEPFKSAKASFNVRGVLQPSQESGCDEPSRGVWRNTAIGASFDALGSERYMLTEDNRALRDIAAHVPYDVVYIMVNSPRYGGGGIYNLFCTFTTGNQWASYIFIHEFGHAFAGLADEYYTSSVAYNEFYPKGIEPTEENITALLDPSNLKWKDLVTAGTAVPTPWEKRAFDEMDNAYQKIRGEVNDAIAKAMREGAPAAEVETLKAESERLSKAHADKMDAFLAKSAFVGKVGAFEGAGYEATGLYRSEADCIMFSRNDVGFCDVCSRAIVRVIELYTE